MLMTGCTSVMVRDVDEVDDVPGGRRRETLPHVAGVSWGGTFFDTRGRSAVGDESVNYASAYAFKRITGDEEDFYEAWDQHRAARPGPDLGSVDMGEAFDFDDPDEMHRRLPRLAALYLTPGEQGLPRLCGLAGHPLPVLLNDLRRPM